MRKKWYREDIINFVEENNYTFIDFVEFKGKSSRILVQCDKKHNPYEVKFNNFYNNKRCPKCKAENNATKTKYEDVKKYIESFNCKLLSKEYKDNKSEIVIQCEHGHVQKTTYLNFKRRKEKCTRCSNREKIKIEDVRTYVESFNFSLLSKDYINNSEPLKIQCDKGHKIEKSFEEFRNLKEKCVYCSGKRKLYDEVKEYIESFNYKLLSSEYINNTTPLEMECSHGHVFSRSLANFNRNQNCPICGCVSKGEERLQLILDEHGVHYSPQHYFENCKTTRVLPFDFYLPQYNVAIEYDGRQHYEYGCFNITLLDLMNIKYRDDIKTNYCRNNNIKLIRIKYTDFDNIEQILIKELNLK